MSGIPAGGDYMAGRRESVAELFAVYDSPASDPQGDPDLYPETFEDAQEAIEALALSVDVERHVVILLGTGGPHDELDVTLDSDGDVREVRYLYAWGSERFETHVSESDPLHRLAEHFVEIGGGDPF